jgi:hypothetical protein
MEKDKFAPRRAMCPECMEIYMKEQPFHRMCKACWLSQKTRQKIAKQGTETYVFRTALVNGKISKARV